MSYPFDHQEVKGLSQEELFHVIDDWMNCHSSMRGYPKLSEALNCTHRTLQECFISFLFTTMLQYGRDHRGEFSFDDRNKDAVMLCRKMVELVDAGELPQALRYI